MNKTSQAFARILALLVLAMLIPSLSWSLIHTTVADFKLGGGDGGVQITNTGGIL